MSDYGVKISLPGSDVKTCGLKDLIFHSKYPLLKIKNIAEGNFDVVVSGGVASGTQLIYTHNLGYSPRSFVFMVYLNSFTNGMVGYRMIPVKESSSGGVIFHNYYPVVTTTTLSIYYNIGGVIDDTYTFYYYYYVYYEDE